MNASQTAKAQATKSDWARQPERSNMLMLRVMTWISLRLGRRAGRVVLAFISLYFVLFAPAARRASRAYLARALGRAPTWRDGFRHVHAFASTIHDRIYLLNERFGLFDIDIDADGTATLHELLAPGRGAFLMGAHLGSFEVARAVGRREPGLRVGMVMYEDNARRLNAMLSAINPAATQNVIALGRLDAMLEVRERLDEGMVLGVLGDRAVEHGPTLAVPFLGAPAHFPVGPMRLAATLKRPVMFMAGLYLGGNRYAIHLERLADFSGVTPQTREVAIREALAAYAACLERHCRAAPYNWFNFFDFWRAPHDPRMIPAETGSLP
jgi:predicted LPLAT superfamily acyltransferase